MLDLGCWSSNGGTASAGTSKDGGSGTRAGSGSRDADKRGLDLLDFRWTGLGSLSASCSEDDMSGSSSSPMPGMFGALERRGTCGEFEEGFAGLRFRGRLRARGEGGDVGAGDEGVIL